MYYLYNEKQHSSGNENNIVTGSDMDNYQNQNIWAIDIRQKKVQNAWFYYYTTF